MAKFKDKERILKAAREKQTVIYKGAPIRLSANYSTETLHARGNVKKYSNEKQRLTIMTIPSSKPCRYKDRYKGKKWQ